MSSKTEHSPKAKIPKVLKRYELLEESTPPPLSPIPMPEDPSILFEHSESTPKMSMPSIRALLRQDTEDSPKEKQEKLFSLVWKSEPIPRALIRDPSSDINAQNKDDSNLEESDIISTDLPYQHPIEADINHEKYISMCLNVNSLGRPLERFCTKYYEGYRPYYESDYESDSVDFSEESDCDMDTEFSVSYVVNLNSKKAVPKKSANEQISTKTQLDHSEQDISQSLSESRLKSVQTLFGRLNSIIEKYHHTFSNESDVIDLESGEIVLDNGYMAKVFKSTKKSHGSEVESVNFGWIDDQLDDYDEDHEIDDKENQID